MEISLKYSQWITLLSLSCLCVRLCVCQSPPTSSPNTNQPGICKSCRPGWIAMLENFKSLVVGRMDPICTFAKNNKVVSECTTVNRKCRRDKNVDFCCCPLSNLSLVQECLPTATAACIPNRITPWQNGFQAAFFSTG